MQVAFDSAADLAGAVRGAAAAHGRHVEAGRADPDWPGWYAQYMLPEQAGRGGEAGPGGGT
jgi:hypothetical protein